MPLIACSPAPDGHDHWPLQLLGQRLVELGYVEHISPETVRQVFKKTVVAEGASGRPHLAELVPARFEVGQEAVAVQPEATQFRLALLSRA